MVADGGSCNLRVFRNFYAVEQNDTSTGAVLATTYNRTIYEDNQTNLDIVDNFNNIGVFQKIIITLYSIIFLLGIIGNGLVIWIAGFRMKKTISVVWFLHLAIADLLCCASMPLLITHLASVNVCRSFSSKIFCSLNIFLLYINMSASVLLLTAMSIDRWVSVMWPFWAKVHRTQKRVRIAAGIIWGLSLFWAGIMFYLLVFYVLYVSDIYNTAMTIQLIRLVLMFVIPFLIIFTSYVTIFLKIKKSNRPQRSQRPYRIITAVILGFFVCWAPYYIWPLTPLYRDTFGVEFYVAHLIVNSLAYLNSCINPIIYVFMGQDFRPGFLKSIAFRVEKALGDHPDEFCRERKNFKPLPNKDV
ncbi:C5a anaphylatoxin chemotactic receptor 1-like [Engystomops pustulosus]|uniref:C5a anaphylatoxin chemotactic receptor 1-like n=1 Tax=Engystomops pustulosus TaxID=76066 RepID=UPI003AFB1EA5